MAWGVMRIKDDSDDEWKYDIVRDSQLSDYLLDGSYLMRWEGSGYDEEATLEIVNGHVLLRTTDTLQLTIL